MQENFFIKNLISAKFTYFAQTTFDINYKNNLQLIKKQSIQILKIKIIWGKKSIFLQILAWALGKNSILDAHVTVRICRNVDYTGCPAYHVPLYFLQFGDPK